LTVVSNKDITTSLILAITPSNPIYPLYNPHIHSPHFIEGHCTLRDDDDDEKTSSGSNRL